jgi:hypothetical protein
MTMPIPMRCVGEFEQNHLDWEENNAKETFPNNDLHRLYRAHSCHLFCSARRKTRSEESHSDGCLWNNGLPSPEGL